MKMIEIVVSGVQYSIYRTKNLFELRKDGRVIFQNDVYEEVREILFKETNV